MERGAELVDEYEAMVDPCAAGRETLLELPSAGTDSRPASSAEAFSVAKGSP
jgi:hypothetical protein